MAILISKGNFPLLTDRLPTFKGRANRACMAVHKTVKNGITTRQITR